MGLVIYSALFKFWSHGHELSQTLKIHPKNVKIKPMYVCMRACMFVRICVCKCMYVYVCLYECGLYVCACLYACVYVRMSACLHFRTYACM